MSDSKKKKGSSSKLITIPKDVCLSLGYQWHPFFSRPVWPRKDSRQTLVGSYHYDHTKFLSSLPVEIVELILALLDLPTVLRLRLVDATTLKLIDSVPQLNRLLQVAFEPLEALSKASIAWQHALFIDDLVNSWGQMETLPHKMRSEFLTAVVHGPADYQEYKPLKRITLGELNARLLDPQCHRCHDYGPFLDLTNLAMKRLCFNCINSMSYNNERRVLHHFENGRLLQGVSYTVILPTVDESNKLEETGIWCRGCEDRCLANFGTSGRKARMKRYARNRAFTQTNFRKHVLSCRGVQSLVKRMRKQKCPLDNIYNFLCNEYKHLDHNYVRDEKVTGWTLWMYE